MGQIAQSVPLMGQEWDNFKYCISVCYIHFVPSVPDTHNRGTLGTVGQQTTTTMTHNTNLKNTREYGAAMSARPATTRGYLPGMSTPIQGRISTLM